MPMHDWKRVPLHNLPPLSPAVDDLDLQQAQRRFVVAAGIFWHSLSSTRLASIRMCLPFSAEIKNLPVPGERQRLWKHRRRV